MAKAGRGRPAGELNWPLVEQLTRFHAPIRYIARQLKTDETRLCREIKKIYKETWIQFSDRLKEEGSSFIIGKMWQKASQGNDKWMAHMGKFYCGHNDFELERQVKAKHEKNDSEVKKGTMDQLIESSREMLKNVGPCAEPKPEKRDEEE